MSGSGPAPGTVSARVSRCLQGRASTTLSTSRERSLRAQKEAPHADDTSVRQAPHRAKAAVYSHDAPEKLKIPETEKDPVRTSEISLGTATASGGIKAVRRLVEEQGALTDEKGDTERATHRRLSGDFCPDQTPVPLQTHLECQVGAKNRIAKMSRAENCAKEMIVGFLDTVEHGLI